MGTKGYKIICGKCGGAGPYVKIEDFANKMDAQEKAKESWNRRAKDEDELIQGRVENDPVVIAAKCAPTAYDPDKVVERLEERTAFLNDCTKYGNNTAEQQDKSYGTMMMYEVKDLVDDLLEIVKGGGTDGN